MSQWMSVACPAGRRVAAIMVLLLAMAPAIGDDLHPLEPVDTSSPRALLQGFLEDLDAAWSAINERALKGKPTRADAARVEFLARRILRRMDLSGVAPTARVEQGYDAATYLYEVLNRIELPPPTEIPGASDFAPGLVRAEWRIPHTDIAIVRITEGDRAGEFLFDRDTVARAQSFFLLTEDLPYRREMPVQYVNELRQIVPGWMISAPFVRSLPGPFLQIVFGQAVWKLVAFALMLIIIGLLLWLARRLTRHLGSGSPVRVYLGRLLVPALLLALLPVAVYLTTEQINLVGTFAQGVRLGADGIAIVVGSWAVWLACLAIAEAVIAAPGMETSSLNAQLLRLAGRIAGIVLALTIIFVGANRIGLPLLGVLAGVGVGGLAVALAAQDSLKNLLGSLMIFMDRPYQPGQRIVVEGQDGFVEKIGLRSTRIRLMSGAMATIPNEKMARLDIENIGERTFMRRIANLRIPIDTPPDKIEQALAIIAEILEDHEGMRPELPPRIFLSEFNPDSLNIFFTYWYHPPRVWKFYAFNQQVNLQILRRFAEAGIRLAYPTSTTRLIRETGGDDPLSVDGR